MQSPAQANAQMKICSLRSPVETPISDADPFAALRHAFRASGGGFLLGWPALAPGADALCTPRAARIADHPPEGVPGCLCLPEGESGTLVLRDANTAAERLTFAYGTCGWVGSAFGRTRRSSELSFCAKQKVVTLGPSPVRGFERQSPNCTHAVRAS
jgi:hypothetical protein